LIRFASLGSGSAGNALVVECGDTRIMLDCGLTVRETEIRCARLGIVPAQLAGILVTHEHEDHIGGVFQFARKHALPVWLTYGTWRAIHPDPDSGVESGINLIDSHVPFALGDLEVLPFPVPHDAREPVQYVFSDGARRLGVLTDTGTPTPHITAMLGSCDALVIECNHDMDMLARGPYPAWLKQRVGGPFGHLANDQAAALLGGLDTSRLTHLVAAHLSTTNNAPALARACLAGVVNCDPTWIGVADAKLGFDWRDV
jgi:phosphoribosyl 1,2-cyclic phosphodiesterase